MTILFRTPTLVAGNTGTEPTGTVSGDMVVAIVKGPLTVPSLPPGWTSVSTFQDSTLSASFLIAAIVRGSGAPSYTFTGANTVTLFSLIGTSFQQPPSVANITAAFARQDTAATAVTFPAVTSVADTTAAILLQLIATSTSFSSNPPNFTQDTTFSSTHPFHGLKSVVHNGPWFATLASAIQFMVTSVGITDPIPPIVSDANFMFMGVS